MKSRIFQLFFTIGLRGLAMGSALVIALLLGRVAGAEVLGHYYVYIGLTGVTAVILSLGQPLQTARFVRQHLLQNDQTNAQKLHTKATKTIFIPSICLLIVLAIAQSFLPSFWSHTAWLFFAISACSQAMARLCAETSKAAIKPSLGVVLEFGLVPTLLALCIAALALTDQTIDTAWVVRLHAISAFTTALIGQLVVYYVLRSSTSQHPNSKPKPSLKPNSKSTPNLIWLRWDRHLMSVDLLGQAFIAAPVLMVDHLASSAAAAEFGLAQRFMGIAGAVLSAQASIFAPKFVVGPGSEKSHVQKVYRSSQIACALTIGPMMLILIFASPYIKSLFLDQPLGWFWPLIVLSVARMTTAYAGCCQQVLSMNGLAAKDLRNGLIGMTALGCGGLLGLLTGQAIWIACGLGLGIAYRTCANWIFTTKWLKQD